MASETVITALKIVGFILLGVSILMMGGILYLWRQSRNRKRSHRQTQATSLEPSSTMPHALQARPSQKQRDKKQEAKRRQNLAWGVVDEESGEKDAEEMGGIGTLSTDAIRRMGIARTDSGLLGTAVLHKTDTRPRPANGLVQHLATQKTNVTTPGIGSGNGPRLPPKALDMPDSHRKLSDNPFSNDHAASRSLTDSRSPNALSTAKSAHIMRPSRPVRPSEAGSPRTVAPQPSPYLTGSRRFPDAASQKTVAMAKPDPRGH